VIASHDGLGKGVKSLYSDMAGIGRAKLTIVPDILLVKDNSIHISATSPSLDSESESWPFGLFGLASPPHYTIRYSQHV
jgi:hypothetical protein